MMKSWSENAFLINYMKIKLVGPVNYNVFTHGRVIHPKEGTVIQVTKMKENGAGTWLEIRGTLGNSDKPVRFSINPKNFDIHLEKLEDAENG